ncbi:gas vesicle protein GvpJ [Streptomyces tropicalis]|uniref:Gas vesicle protein A n=1 Tax=Streptomyces tropicalis TaxID=3034234 RepID=A0ABT6A2F7_9ACTN|nr:gas vesicle protein GvpJ [Streptomyces tropicalis]MDF3298831.1 gas vesicle structural protein GvpA [Streptomyces tropicalis]
MTVVPQGGGSVSRGGGSSSLYDVLELILDRGLVIDVFIRVSLVGIEILKIDIRIVVASVDTYLRFAEACNRLDLEAGSRKPAQLTDIVGDTMESGARGKTKGALGGAVEAVAEKFGGGSDDEDEEDDREETRSRRREPADRRRRAPTRRPARRRERDEE